MFSVWKFASLVERVLRQSFAGGSAELHVDESQPSAQLPQATAVHGTAQVTQNNQNTRETYFGFFVYTCDQ